jgi:hypothetical protein
MWTDRWPIDWIFFFRFRRLAALPLRLVNQSDTAARQQEVEGATRRKEKKSRQAPKIRLASASRARPTFQTDRPLRWPSVCLFDRVTPLLTHSQLF